MVRLRTAPEPKRPAWTLGMHKLKLICFSFSHPFHTKQRPSFVFSFSYLYIDRHSIMYKCPVSKCSDFMNRDADGLIYIPPLPNIHLNLKACLFHFCTATSNL